MPPPNPPRSSPPPIGEAMLEPGEKVLTVVHRSIIALIGVYLEIIAGVAALVALLLVLSPGTLHDLSNHSSSSLLIIAILFIALMIILLFLVTYIYLQNKLLITDRTLVQITQ